MTIDDLLSLAIFLLSSLPLLLFVFFDAKSNVKRKNRYRQYPMPFLGLAYCVAAFILLDKLTGWLQALVLKLIEWIEQLGWETVSDFIKKIYEKYAALIMVFVFNFAVMLAYVILKRIITLILGRIRVKENSRVGKLISVFYAYNTKDERWYIKQHFGQARTFLKAVYYGSVPVLILTFVVSAWLFSIQLLQAPFYPVFPLILVGEVMFFLDGLRKDEVKEKMSYAQDDAQRMGLYPLLRKPLRALFGDKLASDGTTCSDGVLGGMSIDEILKDMENQGHLGQNYALFIRRKMEGGLKPHPDYVRVGYDLASGKSLLVNTPFYDKLNPYMFYAMNRALLQGGKVMVVLGRHGTEEDLLPWCDAGVYGVTNIPKLWKIRVLDQTPCNDENMPDIGIMTRSGVHDLDIHKANMPFLTQVSFVFIVEPSRLVATAQVGLNLLIRDCGNNKQIVYCSVDRNCDGLVDSMSHILMTNLTEVSATEFPPGISSYMCWKADGDYLQHRMVSGLTRYLGIGTELSFTALKNQVETTIWYGNETFPVRDAHWIAKQYYAPLLEYAELPATQDTFDKVFRVSFNLCDEREKDYSFIVVEDERNNVFETKRNFATIARMQGFVNVVSSEYLMREYMTENPALFDADAKAIPFITADYARTKRNAILTTCLRMCVDGIREEDLKRDLLLMGMDPVDPIEAFWDAICALYGVEECGADGKGRTLFRMYSPVKKQELTFTSKDIITLRRVYFPESGQFENVYLVGNRDFADVMMDDLRNAGYIAERDREDHFIGTELKGHIYQKYLPGQFFTLNGKYYEMMSVTPDNRVLLRRASEHISGRMSYRQIRHYEILRIREENSMDALRTLNGIEIWTQTADFRVRTTGYWAMKEFNNFRTGNLVELTAIPDRVYREKQILRLDFSRFGDLFTEEIRHTLTLMLNELFVTLFAENRPFIAAVTSGVVPLPDTYSMSFGEGEADANCIYIFEDSQLDIGLLVAFERNLERILQIISDYLDWNDEMIDRSMNPPTPPAGSETVKNITEAVEKLEGPRAARKRKRREKKELRKKKRQEKKELRKKKKQEKKELRRKKKEGQAVNGDGAETKEKKKNVFSRFFGWLKSKFSRKKKEPEDVPPPEEPLNEGETSDTQDEPQTEPQDEPQTEPQAEPPIDDEPGREPESGEETVPEPEEHGEKDGLFPEDWNFPDMKSFGLNQNGEEDKS